jgi:hypothetical protein
MNTHDQARILKLAEELHAKLEQILPDDAVRSSGRFEQLAIVGIATWEDQEGYDCEAPIYLFETSRPHVQLGIVSGIDERLRDQYRA